MDAFAWMLLALAISGVLLAVTLMRRTARLRARRKPAPRCGCCEAECVYPSRHSLTLGSGEGITLCNACHGGLAMESRGLVVKSVSCTVHGRRLFP